MIDMYFSPKGFLFRKGAKEVGTAPYETLILNAHKGASKDDLRDMQCSLNEYTIGEVVTRKGLDDLVLGPKREFTHAVTLHAVGNPDMGQFAPVGPKKTVMVCGIDEAIEAVKVYQHHYNMGGGNCAKEHGVVWELPKSGKSKRKKVGEVNYAYRYWTIAEKAAWEAEIKAKYATPAS